MGALQEFVDNFTYLGIFAVLLLGSLGVPIPEEMPIIAAAVLSHEGIVRWWLALPLCLLGVLSGDMVLYWVGRHWGEQVLSWRLVRLVLSPAREQWLKAAYRRHALKTVVTARHVMGLRAAAFLTAGSANVPFWKFVVADAGAALFGVPLVFGFAYFFTDQIKVIMADVHRAERWLVLAGLLALAAMLVVGVWRWHRRVAKERLDEEPAEGEIIRPGGIAMSLRSQSVPGARHHDEEAAVNTSVLAGLDAYWRAANYLTVGQIYLQDNPLLREPLKAEHIKPRLLGHWGTSPGLSFIYAHLNRLIRETDADVIYLAGPGHGGPAIVANVYLEGTYSEIYPEVSQDVDGMHRLFRQFSTPGGIPSHVSVPTPGSIHEGGELGYVLVHAFGAAFDNPDLVVVAVVGDGEAETAPLEGAWKGTHFLNPARDGAVLPILHLNGYKIAGPTVLGRSSDDEITSLLHGHGYDAHIVEGDEPMVMHQRFAAVLDGCYREIRAIQDTARRSARVERPRWPAIVLRTPKGWTGPKEVDGKQIEGTCRAHQVPLSNVTRNADHLRQLETWMRSYRPEELFDGEGRLIPALAELAPRGDRRMGANPHANGGRLLVPLDLPKFADYAIPVDRPGRERHESTRLLGKLLRDTFRLNAARRNFRLFCPDETTSNRLGDVFEVENRCLMDAVLPTDDHLSADGRVMEVLSEHNCQGWLEGYLLTGRHGLFASYEAFAMVSASMTVQHAKWLQESLRLSWRKPVASLNVLLTSTCWRNDHNGFSHQGPGLIDVVLSKKGTVSRIYLPPDANCLLSVADHCLRSTNYVNLIVIDKQPQLQWLDMAAAREHCARGASIWRWASNDDGGAEPDVILAAAGDIPTLEVIAAAAWLRRHIPEMKVRVVNVVDLMTLFPPPVHPHGMNDRAFRELFTEHTDVVFAFHGYQRAIHEILHGRANPERFHVRGYNEEGTTTTPFDMVVRNGMSRYHLCIEALRRAPRMARRASQLIEQCEGMLARHERHVRAHLEDMREVSEWTWSDA